MPLEIRTLAAATVICSPPSGINYCFIKNNITFVFILFVLMLMIFLLQFQCDCWDVDSGSFCADCFTRVDDVHLL